MNQMIHFSFFIFESIKTFINKFIIDESAVLAITEEANNTIKSKLKKDFDKSMQKCLNVKMISNLDVFNKPKNLSDNKNKFICSFNHIFIRLLDD